MADYPKHLHDERLLQTSFAAEQETKLVKVLKRLDIVYFIIAAIFLPETKGKPLPE